MRKLFSALFIGTIFILGFRIAYATVSELYVVDEKPQVLFGDSILVGTYLGLENFSTNYIDNYLHISFTYTHAQCCSASYPPRIYIAGIDPRTTYLPDIKYRLPIYNIPSNQPTDWYAYDIQLDPLGFSVLVRQEGVLPIQSFHVAVSNLQAESDWLAVENGYPFPGSTERNSVAFAPLQVYKQPEVQVPAVPTTTPVIIVPGIMGSYLNKEDGTEVWMNLTKMIFPGEDSYLNELSMSSEGTSVDTIKYGDIIKKVNGIDFYDGLYHEKQLGGYLENIDLFSYPYDWRLDLEKTTDELLNRIEEIKVLRGVKKVDLIAHSMGGLIVKNFIKKYGASSVSRFIDIATPHVGAPKTFKTIVYGDNFGFEKFGLSILNPLRTKEISQNMPSVYELLPSQKYFDDSDPNYRYYVLNGVGGSKRLSYDEASNYLKTSGRNSALVDRANAFHQEIDGLDPRDYGVETYNIVGCGTPTLGQFHILDDSEEHPIYNIHLINGDGTVPLRSAEAMPANATFYAKGAVHALMPSMTGVKELVANILTSTTTQIDISPYPNISTSSDGCSIPDGQIVSFHSPIELHVYDQVGNHSGPDANGDIENNIPNVVYEVLDDNKFAYLPNGVEYTIKGLAMGEGTFDVRIQNIINEEVSNTKVFASIPISTRSRTQFIVGSDEVEEIPLDSNEDGTFDTNYPVTSTSNGVLESTGKVVVLPAPKSAEVYRDKSQAIRASTSAPSDLVIAPQVLGTTTVSIAITKPVVIPSEPEKVPEHEVRGITTKYQDTAIASKSSSFGLKGVLVRLWRWLISKL